MNQRRSVMPQAHEMYLDRLLGDVRLLVLHETDALRGHLVAAEERLRVARRARGIGELLRDQVDLLPESRNRWRRDHQIRRELWRGLVRDLRSRPRASRRTAARAAA